MLPITVYEDYKSFNHFEHEKVYSLESEFVL